VRKNHRRDQRALDFGGYQVWRADRLVLGGATFDASLDDV
jgi:hypothetical protein